MIDAIMIPVIASVIWSLNPAVVSRWARNAPPLLFTAVRALAAILFIAPIIVLRGSTVNEISPLAIALIFLSAVAGPGIGDAAYVRAIQLLGGSLAIVISYTYVFFAQAFALALGLERLAPWTALGSAIAFLGVGVAVLNNNITINGRGAALALAAAVSWGAATVLIKMVQPYMDAITLSFTRLLMVIAIMILGSLLTRENRNIDRGFLIAAGITGALGWGIGMVLFVYAIYVIGPSSTAIATVLTPVLSQITTKVIGREGVSKRTVAGAALVALGIMLANVDRLI